LSRCRGVVGVELESTHDPEEHLARVWVRGARAVTSESLGERVFVETSAEEVASLSDVGSGRFVQGDELYVLVERARETERELGRCQGLLHSVNGALSQALTNLGGQHRVLDRLVREQRTRSHAVTKAEKSRDEARHALHELRTSSLHLLDELCERLPGSRLSGRYEISRRLGHGASSVVFQAHDTKCDERVALRALRVIGAQWAPRVAAQAARIEEAGIGRIPRVREAFTWAGAIPFVATVEVEGRSLRRILAEQGPLDEARAVTIVRGLLDVLAAAHEAGLSHGDVRPEHVLVSETGPLLLELELSPVTAHLPKPGSSRAYRPFEGRETSPTPAGDVFGVGAVLLELLTGEPPVEGVARRVPSSRMGVLCASALEPNAGSRPTARELAEALASLAPRVSLTGLLPAVAPGTREESGVYERPSGTGKTPRTGRK
jgi:serine/threonine-protein kinase